MKTKLEMAHEWYMLQTRRNGCALVADAWRYADAMQAEVDKREKEEVDKQSAELRNILKLSKFKPLELQPDLKEWQPDWSQAPEWANWWAMDGFSKKANWYIDKPYLDDDSEVESEWNIDLKTNTETYMHAPSFGYTGDWRNSLRKRPQ